jgi:hypothetical protein
MKEIKSGHHDHVWAYVENGRLIELGVDRGREGGVAWRRAYLESGKPWGTREHLIEHLAYYVDDFGIKWYRDVYESATVDSHNGLLPTPLEIENIVMSKKVARKCKRLEKIIAEIETLEKEQFKLEEEIGSFDEDGIIPAESGTYNL